MQQLRDEKSSSFLLRRSSPLTDTLLFLEYRTARDGFFFLENGIQRLGPGDKLRPLFCSHFFLKVLLFLEKTLELSLLNMKDESKLHKKIRPMVPGEYPTSGKRHPPFLGSPDSF